MTLPALPLPDARPDPESEGLIVKFQFKGWGSAVALIFNEDDTRIDEIHASTFREAYDAVIENYPQARWVPEEEA